MSRSVRNTTPGARQSNLRFRSLVGVHGAGRAGLELGCGSGVNSHWLAREGGRVTGIDISGEALARARDHPDRKPDRAPVFCRMDAECLTFADECFDLVFGSSILHHLNLNRALPGIVRVLRRDGSAIFLEPLGHNPLINRFRLGTPELRTVDEHPLLMSDLRLIRGHFAAVNAEYFHLLSLAAVPFRARAGFKGLLRGLERADGALFRFVPSVRKYAWIVILHCSCHGQSTRR